jgi:uncharacterized membrane protein YhaH (DUF805 family)
MWGAIKHGLGNLANFNGRDARRTFWFWVLAVVLLRFAVNMALTLPITMRMMSRFVAVGIQDGSGDPVAMQAKMHSMMVEMMATELPRMVWIGIAVSAVSTMLLVASLVRRLHDSDLPGWLVLVPGLMSVTGLAMAPAQIETALKLMNEMKPGVQPNMSAMMQASLGQSLLVWVPIALVIWFGVRKSTDGLNRYGDAPVAF